MPNQIYLVPLLPLIGFLLNGLFGKMLGKRFVSIVGPSVIALAFLQSAVLFVQMISSEQQLVQQHLYTWMASGVLSIDVAFQVDVLSGLFILIITGIGFLIHVYSVGYMYEEESYYRYFSYLNFFVFFMLILVLGDNLLLMFVGWEGVGLCSYLLIGYYFKKVSAGDAAKKAFLFNRVGDFGVISAGLILFITLGTLNFDQINARTAELSVFGATLISLLLFLGATGKSAQLPLFVWLPDAMEGPTPVSALIHAATMVTSGLYMIARLNPLFAMSPFAMNVIAVVGAITALLAATIAVTQTDIKRVLAYSTVSQLGYMFLAMGVGAFSTGIFHVMTHAFFKALLFLGSGAVIHSMHHEQDMTKMGGLWNRLPWTYGTMLIGTIAIAGIFPFAGFFSKDEILWYTWNQGHHILWGMGFVTAGLTSFYMFRLIFMTFHGPSRLTPDAESHLHESPWVMLFPLVMLAILSTVGGWIGIPHVFPLPHLLEAYFEGFFVPMGPGQATVTEEIVLMVLSVALALASAKFAWSIYGSGLQKASAWKQKLPFPHQVSLNKWYVDEIYDMLIIQPSKWISTHVFWKAIDVNVIDRTVVSTGSLARHIGGALRLAQTGVLQNYTVFFSLGTLFVLWYLVF